MSWHTDTVLNQVNFRNYFNGRVPSASKLREEVITLRPSESSSDRFEKIPRRTIAVERVRLLVI